MDEKRLADLVMLDEDFAKLEQILDIFCPFEAVGMVRQEIRHAHFLAYYLDPNRPHGFGDACLRAFLTKAIEAQGKTGPSGIGILDIHMMDLQNASVRREWRDIDLLIEIPSAEFALAAELKIDAAEGKGQLAKYKKTLEEEHPTWSLYFAFLTKSGEDASDDQAENWVALGLDTVARGLQQVVDRVEGESPSISMLKAYLDMLRRHHLSNDRLEQIATDLWKRHREALQFLVERQPNALSDAMSRISEQKDAIALKLSKETGLKVVFDSASGTTDIRFAVVEWDDVLGLKGKSTWTESQRFILLALSRGPNNVKVILQLGKGDKATRDEIYKRLRSEGAPIKNPSRFTSEWKRLSSETLLTIKDDDELEAKDLYESLEKKTVEWAKKTLKIYDKALRPQSAK
jgi:hypothetical protein